jgi:hypothetical protein
VNTDDFPGPPVRGLGELRAIRPAEAWEYRVHAKCRAAIARERRPHDALGHLVDAALVTAVGLYLASVVTAALAVAAAG